MPKFMSNVVHRLHTEFMFIYCEHDMTHHQNLMEGLYDNCYKVFTSQRSAMYVQAKGALAHNFRSLPRYRCKLHTGMQRRAEFTAHIKQNCRSLASCFHAWAAQITGHKSYAEQARIQGHSVHCLPLGYGCSMCYFVHSRIRCSV